MQKNMRQKWECHLRKCQNNMEIRYATMQDLTNVAAVERECFPPAEAATAESFQERLRYFPNHFWLLFVDGKLVSFVDGMVTNLPDLTDEMYEKADMHDENGAWQMIFGVNTIPFCRNRGYAGMLLKKAIEDAKNQGRKGLVLTCKAEKVSYYEKFGFVKEFLSESTHGGAVWYQMRLAFTEK